VTQAVNYLVSALLTGGSQASMIALQSPAAHGSGVGQRSRNPLGVGLLPAVWVVPLAPFSPHFSQSRIGRSADAAETSLRATLSANRLFQSESGAREKSALALRKVRMRFELPDLEDVALLVR
jgi:hypothetical protein